MWEKVENVGIKCSSLHYSVLALQVQVNLSYLLEFWLRIIFLVPGEKFFLTAWCFTSVNKPNEYFEFKR